MSAGRDVAIHIGELVVDGAGPIDRERLAAAVTAELGRLVVEGGARPAPAAHARIDAGTIAATPAGDASATIGRRVARAVHGVLGGER